MRVVDKPDNSKAVEFDSIDLQIIKLRTDNPRISVRDIADVVGIGKSAVWKRLQKIGESEFVLAARNELVGILPLALHVYLRALLDPKKNVKVARDILFGLGVLKQRHELTGEDGGPIQVTGPVFVLRDNGSAEKIDDKPNPE